MPRAGEACDGDKHCAVGVEFSCEIEDHGYGFVTYFKLPDGSEVQLYEPKYEKG